MNTDVKSNEGKTLRQIRDEILAQKPVRITESQFEDIKYIFQQEMEVNERKADFLFDIKNKSKHNICPGFKDWFVDQISKYLLEYGDSHGEIDDREAKWLKGKIRHYDEIDRELIDKLEEQTGKSLPEDLKRNSAIIQRFEKLLYSSRYFSVLAVVGALVSSMILFLQGFWIIVNGLIGFFHEPEENYEVLFERLVSSVDVFLFALVLIIFGAGVYELFISNKRVDSTSTDQPSWLKIKSVDDLKSSLGKVILMVLIVSFFKHVLAISAALWTPLALLYLSVGICLIGVTLYLTHKSHVVEPKDE